MILPSETIDRTLGTLSLVDETAYFAEVPWNRGLHIRLFIHIEDENYNNFIEDAKKIFLLVRENEQELFEQAAELISLGENAESFLDSATETSIEIYPSGEGALVYLVMMVGSLIIEFSSDASFKNAQAREG